MRLAIAGAGVIGTVHANAIGAVPDAELVWIADPDLARAETLANASGARATADLDQAFADPHVAAVIVAVPTPLHREVVECAAAHGKHVLCEKPIARTVADAEAIVAACDRAGVRLMVGQVVRFFPEYARIEATLRDGALGQIGVVRTSRVGPAPTNTRPWMADRAAGGGVVIDLMVHELDLLRWYFGEIARVFANGAGTDYAQAVIRFESGAIAHVEASWAHARFRTTIEIAGEHGILRHDSEETAPLRIDRPLADTRPPVELRRAAPALPYQRQLRHFIDGITGDTPLLTDGEQGLRALEAALAVQASIERGQPVAFMNGRPKLEEVTA